MANESEINLGLALGSSNQQQVESSGAGAGAGAGSNANSRLRIDNKTFVRPCPLPELVWSTQNGLSIKCADCSTCFADNNPCCLYKDVPSSQHEKYENVDEMKCVQFIEMESKGKETESLTNLKSILVGNVAGTSEGPHNQRTADLLPLLESKTENIGDGTDRLGLNIRLPLEIKEPTVHVKRDEDDSNGSGSSPEKMEETAENDVQDLIAKDAILENVERDLVPGEAPSSDSRMRVQNREESCKEGNKSHGSMESCNSANSLSKGNKRWRFSQQLIIGSKRIKKQSQGCPFSTPVIKQDSSFMNWISNMVKGIKPCQEEGHGHSLALSLGHPIDDDQKMDTCDKTLNFVTKKLGFQTVFQSLYSQDAKRLETTTQIENKFIGDSKEVILFDKTVSNHVPDDTLNQKAFGNLWIARFSPKTPSTLLSSNNSDLRSFVARDSSTDEASASVSLKQLEEPVALTLKTSIDVLKHTRPMVHSKTSCFFCGKRGHELRDCIQINEKEVEGFMKNIRLYEGLAKEAPCLCIKCFQLNHWASACPSKRGYKTKESWSDLNLKLKEKGNVLFKKKVSNFNEISKHPASSSGKILGIPKKMFDTIRRLRLSRTDILKWMNSRLPISSLDGYFLRLKLAKCEEGVGGAGYYVGCITDDNPSKGSKKPICVNIGGVECLVESRYISNCDFLEDELIGWWRTMLTSRRRLPIEEELASKLEDRKRLGF
ncbi:uncharacterized protein LOC112519801 isoform X2 [Cynara cardunculus var. scolymus]|uniref:Plus-3 n=1 Tax=Cynara cardunculus var. scolymus TaxID=59895 RepID=A0A124SEP6_CYNCS|nr:uncharacterized protein LOC112519801 isoform X2 [Cynara cardunculus var. scolymus]KVI00793.1 Plus-3 [Cynara cardunculus var. scolymus]